MSINIFEMINWHTQKRFQYQRIMNAGIKEKMIEAETYFVISKFCSIVDISICAIASFYCIFIRVNRKYISVQQSFTFLCKNVWGFITHTTADTGRKFR